MSYGPPIAPGRPPPGWQPPFAGAPPPAPPGVNPQTWGAGAWHWNTAYQWPTQGAPVPPNPPNSAGWAPGYGWYGGMQPGMQMPVPYNPYKRVPRAPSAEYMATELVDNPLGLTNMIPREELRGEDGAPSTPWVWNPPGLISTEADDGVITADFRDEQGRKIAQEVRAQTASRQSSLDRVSDSSAYPHANRYEGTPSRQNSHDRPNGSLSIYAPNPHSDTTPSRRSSNDRPNERSSDHAQDIRRDSTPSRQNSHDRPNEPSSAHSGGVDSHSSYGRPKDSTGYYQRYQSPGTSDSPPRHSPSRASYTPEKPSQLSSRRDKVEDQSFTAKIDLQPTFSTNIVRIPDHYQSPARRSSSRDDDSNRSSPSVHSHSSSGSSSVSHITSRMDRMHIGNNPGPMARHPSLQFYAPTSTTNDTSEIVEEPASMLSPLVYATTPMTSNRTITRGYSAPEIRGTHLKTIPESSPSLPVIESQSHHSSPASSHEERSTPPSGYPVSHLLPRPPMEIYAPLTSAPPPRMPTPPPGTYSKRARLGYWNRRGDHVTRDQMYVVYAPPDKADPPELADYPQPGEGYRDSRGNVIPYNANRPELPQSLPRHGRPPVYPYDLYVVYDYQR